MVGFGGGAAVVGEVIGTGNQTGAGGTDLLGVVGVGIAGAFGGFGVYERFSSVVDAGPVGRALVGGDVNAFGAT